MTELLEEMEEAKKDDPNASLIVGEKDGKVVCVVWASSKMKADFHEYPEVVSVDNTRNVNRNGMPLCYLMCQHSEGNGRVAGYIILRDEKQDVLRAAFTCFVDIHSASISKLCTVFVDKDMNEISRIWEILPNVDIVLCRFHVVEIFNRNTPSEPEKEKVRKTCKEMLYCESQAEYKKPYDKLKQVCSDDFLKYFDKYWENTRVVWKGHERLEVVTLGLSTTTVWTRSTK